MLAHGTEESIVYLVLFGPLIQKRLKEKCSPVTLISWSLSSASSSAMVSNPGEREVLWEEMRRGGATSTHKFKYLISFAIEVTKEGFSCQNTWSCDFNVLLQKDPSLMTKRTSATMMMSFSPPSA
ncbi:hypothetical protein L1049_007975 [Liquidambar formosana]|uniref:Uncharacterized protein n=1 Tax=Liquidambar formosana TaxID=63359 RepID=A0AAP0S2Y3_LIQFO